MQLNHINLCVDDITKACAFFQNYFDFQCLERKADAIAVLTDGQGFTLVLSNPLAFKGELRPYSDGFHLGFLLDTQDQVDQTYHRLAATEIPLTREPKKIRNSYGFYFTALNDILFEVSCTI